ncbi:MAG: SDR family NAD(P)-dependent oxidoreductase, partial [Chloroflexota bacterium]
MYDFKDKTAVVTGGTGVLGGEMAAALVGLGANVVIMSRKAKLSADLEARLKGGIGEYRSLSVDVLERKSIEAAVDQIEEEFGPIDILINCAGGNTPQAVSTKTNPFFDLPKEALGFVFNLNTLGTILPCQVVGKSMAARGLGVILNISSMAAFSPLTNV